MPRSIPTIGRRIWYWHDPETSQLESKDDEKPFDAGIIFVNELDNTVTLQVTDHHGDEEILEDVRITDEPEAGCAQWMPYQEAQAAKAAAEASGQQSISGT